DEIEERDSQTPIKRRSHKTNNSEQSHYYPFGLKHQEYSTFGFVSNPIQGVIIAPVANNPFKYKYNGKEFQDELNLNWYDYGARNYDPALGRWMNMDPLAEVYFESSPYNYVANNPTNSFDPNGMWIVNLTSSTDKNGKTSYSLQFTAEEGDDIESLSRQLDISVEELEKVSELKKEISEGSTFGLSEISEVSMINDGLTTILGNSVEESLSNCANVAGLCSNTSVPYQYGAFTSEDNVNVLANSLKVSFNSVAEKDAKIGTIIHYRLLSESKTKNSISQQITQELRAGGKSDAEIQVILAKPDMQNYITNLTKTIMSNERHFSVVVLKDKSGEKVQNIIQKTGTVPMPRKVLPANFNEVNGYLPTPVEGTDNSYYNKKP
ncbi:MAG: RHS repeat-associated core domain-containing protein, partial [Moheibacter sp.]